MSELISAQEAVAKIVDTAIRKISSGEQKLTKEYEQSVKEAVNVILNTARREVVRCNDCKYYGEMLPKKDTRMICHKICLNTKPDDFCSRAKRRKK